jgi:calcineurin-like phosphoesterase family protein
MKLKDILNPDRTFFTADTHFGHGNIIEYCSRPFKGPEEMDLELIKRWNEVVPKTAIVFHLGDFSLIDERYSKEMLAQLNGTILITQGNHDRSKLIRRLFSNNVYDILEICVKDEEVTDKYQKLVLCHYPFAVWNGSHKGYWHLHGHSHGQYKTPNPLVIDVGVDCHDFRPISYQEVKTIITKKALASKRT